MLHEFERRCRMDFADGVGEFNTVTYRGLWANPITGVEGYSDILPRIDGLPFDEYLSQHVTTGSNLHVCDVGYGQGNYLLDVKKLFGADVMAIGFGSPRASQRVNVTGYMEDQLGSHDALTRAGVELVSGNVLDIDRYLSGQSMDVVTMSNVLQYLPYPRAEIFKKIIRVLKPDGVLLTADVVPLFTDTKAHGNETQTFIDVFTCGWLTTFSKQEFIRPKTQQKHRSHTVLVRQMAV
jgi:ubiquinone/menaquinone biosynthesis C-methylase UbiE